jgi:competence protein ComEC
VGGGLGAFGYLFLVGATVPTQRAFLMIFLALIAVIMDRNPISLRLVAAAAFAVLLAAPESLLSASFQMSFAAVTALVAGYEVVASRRERAFAERGAGRRIALYLGGVALTSVIAIAATTPFAIYHFNRMALYGLLANLIAVPLTAFWIMPWAVIAFLLLPLGLEALALAPMGWGIEGMIGTAKSVAGLPGAVLPVRAMPLFGLGLVVLGGLWLCLWRQSWRLAGLAAVAIGLLGSTLARPPDLLASGNGKLLAVRGPDGALWLSSTRRERFTSENWLRRAGLDAGSGRPWPLEGEALGGRLSCDSLGCIYRSGGQVIALVRDPRALIDDCSVATVLISVVPVGKRCSGPAVVIDRFDLWRAGAHALWLEADGPRVERVNDRPGSRPWAPRRGAPRRGVPGAK